MIGSHAHAEAFLKSAMFEMRRLKELADRALGQVPGDNWFTQLDNDSNSLAHLMKHLSGNMRSRWTDFLTTDGEKPDRHRDSEFESEGCDTLDLLSARWEQGWQCMFDALSAMHPSDVERTVLIRGEPFSALQAIHRQMTHYASHVGQMVMLAKHLAGDRWQTLSIPRGRSDEYNASMKRKEADGYLGGRQ
jgi:hypothetical protein